MSRSRKKVFLWKCNCCHNNTNDRIKANRCSRRSKKQKLNTFEHREIDGLSELFERSIRRKITSNYEPRFMRIETKEYVTKLAKWYAKFYGQTKKEVAALEKKYYHRLMSK